MNTAEHNAAMHGLNTILATKGYTARLINADEAFADSVNTKYAIRVLPGEWYVVATARNGYSYYINVSYDSPVAMCFDVLKRIIYK